MLNTKQEMKFSIEDFFSVTKSAVSYSFCTVKMLEALLVWSNLNWKDSL